MTQFQWFLLEVHKIKHSVSHAQIQLEKLDAAVPGTNFLFHFEVR